MDTKWNELYPRPQLVRDEWAGLNGPWRFRTAKRGNAGDKPWETINVPFCPESRLSGIGRRIAPGEKMVYEREISVPASWDDRHVILNFGAVDQIAEVYIDDVKAGSHEGGYLPFSIDITEFIRKEAETTESDIDWSESEEELQYRTCTLRVEATDNLDHRYPWGKQKRKNGGMWYTPVSGIWQSVWMEAVPEEHITSVRIDCGADWVEIRAYGTESGVITLLGRQYQLAHEQDGDLLCAAIHIDIQRPHLWTPEDPYLYEFTIDTPSGDHVGSYFGLRTLTIEEVDGYKRLCLNGRPYFFNGLLDQGYWQDGIYTPESPDKFAGDILAMKSLGFNTLRKHIKVEADRYYYDCDRLGMVVFQDMVNNGDYHFLRDSALPTIGMFNADDTGRHKGVSRKIFLESMDETVRHLYSHPSVCYWTIFNEGWGQFCADEAYDRLRALDSSRFIDSTSGWFHQNRSDVDSYHVYFKPVRLEAGKRPLVLSEFGGYACKLPDHCWNKEKTYGYRKCENEAALLMDMRKLYENEVLPLAGKGLCAAIYTQLSDVEDETNGILTYDREILKFRAYTGSGGRVLLGRFTDSQGGKVITAPAPYGIRAYVAENHSDAIRLIYDVSEPVEISITDRAGYDTGTAAALITGMLEGFADLFGRFDGSGNGFDMHISRSEYGEDGFSPTAAFEILAARIINDRYYNGRANAVELAKIASFAEREYYGRPCGMVDQLAVSLGRLALLDFSGREPVIEYIDTDLEKAGYEIIVPEADYGAGEADEYASYSDDMSAVAEALGAGRLGDLNEEQFRRKRQELEKRIRSGELTSAQTGRAQRFFDENESVLAATVALKAGKTDRFMQYISPSGSIRLKKKD